jgi:thiosulfate/3-mercaptopyruvate sulfurtransferase
MSEPVIVSVVWLQENLNDAAVRILDARVADPRLPMGYRASHVPGAVPFDLNRDMYEMGPQGPRIQSFDSIANTLGERGVSNDDTLIVYDEGTGPLAGMVYWLLRYLGHEDVRVLNGGWYAWQKAGAPTTKDVPEVKPATYTARPDEAQHGTAEWIQEHAGNADVVLLDTRMEDEYAMGHIAGARNLSFDEAIDFQTQGLKDPQVLKHQFETVGVTPDKEVVVYCGSGSRSAHTYLVLKSLGYPRVRNYKGSMHDWSRTRHLPLEY